MLENFLSQLGASTKITIGVSVSPGVGLEMIEVDKLTGTVIKYAHAPLEYNYSTREITDYGQFQDSLEMLFEELHIPKKCNIILNLPNVHFGMINLPLLLTDDAITNAIISEVEQSYIFKRQEPMVSWFEIFSSIESETRTIAYTAIQKTVLDDIKNVCDEIGCTLAGVDNSYASLLRTLCFSGLTKNQMKENVTWNLMIIGQNSYSLLSMSGKKVIEYYEEPLALKSFVDDEIYNAIATSAQITLSGLPSNFLFIVSETDLVSAEVLSMKIPVECSINFLECNKFAQNELIPANLDILPKLALQITPEAIGAAIYNFSDFPLKLNVLAENTDGGSALEESEGYPRINLGNLEVELTPAFVKKVSIIIGIVLILPIFILGFIFSGIINPKEQLRLDNANAKFAQLNAEVSKYNNGKTSAFDLNTAMNNIITKNTTELAYYAGLGVSIPKKLWISYYMSNNAGKVDIKGKSIDVESIYTFYKGLKQLVNNSDIRLYKLEIASESIDDVVSNISTSPRSYDFEITNMTAEELNPPPPPATTGGTTGTPNQQDQGEKKPLFQLGKPLFGQKDTSTQGTGQNNPTPATPGTAPVSTTPTPPTSTPPGQLPKNLEKIEKF